MELVVDKHLKLCKSLMSNLQSIQPRLIKVMDPVPIDVRANEKAYENAKTCKVTVEVVVMHMFGETKSNSPNTNAKIRGSKLGLNRPKTHLEEVQWPPKEAIKGLLVNRKTIRVLLDTGLSGDLFFLEKRIQ
jgi:hypothetical protein